MMLYIILSILAILLIVNIIFTLKAGKKDESNDLNEIKIAELSCSQADVMLARELETRGE